MMNKLNNPIIKKDKVIYDCVLFGSYPQSDASGQTKEPIKWRVLSVDGYDAFLVSDKNLDVQRYHNRFKPVTWETCDLRKWINNEFLNRAFTKEERSAIKISTVKNKDNFKYGIQGGNSTKDKVFLLSIEEVSNPSYGFLALSAEDEARVRRNTAYVAAGGTTGSANMYSAGKSDLWWLRSPGDYTCYAANVRDFGFVDRYGFSVDYNIDAVCPALHLNLKSNYFQYAGREEIRREWR